MPHSRPVIPPDRVRGELTVDFIRAPDLFIDLWIAPDGGYTVLDHARSVLRELIKATERGEFPPAVVREFRL